MALVHSNLLEIYADHYVEFILLVVLSFKGSIDTSCLASFLQIDPEININI